MGVDARASLPPNVRVRDVARVLGILLGVPFSLDALNGDGVYCNVLGADVRGFVDIPEMSWIILKMPNGNTVAQYNFHNENPGGRRLLTGRATAKTIAAFRHACDFFGGVLDYNDCDDEDRDYVVPDFDDDSNHPEDREPWDRMQRRMAELKPLSRKEVAAFEDVACY
jgi:hypothetical protein